LFRDKLKKLRHSFGGFMISRSPENPIVMRSKDNGNGTVAPIPGAFSEVKFDAYESSFLMSYSACENPSCSCTAVVVMFSDKSQRRPGHSRTEFGVELDVNTWQVGRLFGVSSIARPLIDEFVTGLNADQKEGILVKYRSFREAVENAARFSVPADKVRKGYMIAASEVFGVSKMPDSCGLIRPLFEEHQGIVYRLLDYYCINPSCKCGETHLSVVRAYKDSAASDKPWITVRLHFEGKVKVSDVTGSLIPQQAVEVMAEWIRKDPPLLGDIEARYRRIKDTGRRILARAAK
jgi:hypothetical protein